MQEIEHDQVEILMRINMALQVLASPFSKQASKLIMEGNRAAKIADYFEYWNSAMLSTCTAEVAQPQRAGRQVIRDKINIMRSASDSQVWSDDGMRSHREWEGLRVQ